MAGSIKQFFWKDYLSFFKAIFLVNLKELFTNSQKLQELKLNTPEKNSIEALNKAYQLSLEESCRGIKKAAVLFSGGIDSFFVAKTLTEKIPDIKLFCAGTQNSSALKNAQNAAKMLEKELIQIVIDEKSLPVLEKKVFQILKTKMPMQLSIGLTEFAALQEIKKHSLINVFCGQGSDEMFCGYQEFETILKQKGFDAVQEECWNKIFNMFERNLKRDFAIADNFSLKLIAPFLHPDFIKQAMAFPAEEKILSPEDELRKHPIRKLAKLYNVPEDIVNKRKKAMQYDSGVANALKKING